MANSIVCQSKWKPIFEPRRAKPEPYSQAHKPSHDVFDVFLKDKNLITFYIIDDFKMHICIVYLLTSD